MMELRRFNDHGLQTFVNFLDSCRTDNPMQYPTEVLVSPLGSETVEPAVQLELTTVTSRFELAQILDDRFTGADFHPQRSDVGLWAWLSCFWFPEICAKSRNGTWKPGSIVRWIPRSDDFRRYYRHLVAGPYYIYRAHRDDPQRAMAVLCQRPGSPGEVVEQLASRQQIITNPAIMQVASDLYVNPSTRRQNRYGNSKKAGGARRFVEVLAQFDVTWDLSMMSAGDLQDLLPNEFRFA